MKLEQWAARWGVQPMALLELRELFGCESDGSTLTPPPGGEAEVLQQVRLEASRAGGRVWRNNVGAATMLDGSFIRYGLANDSAALNKQIKSSDLIGLRPVIITPEWVGVRLGQFIARECKAPGWRYTGTPREQAQLRFLELVTALGGDAAFCTGVGTL